MLQAYSTFKDTFKDTGDKCRELGLLFMPLVFESHAGGFALAAQTPLGCCQEVV